MRLTARSVTCRPLFAADAPSAGFDSIVTVFAIGSLSLRG
jgi:hypothetical protein